MYIIEGNSNPQFANIPKSMYWAIVTITTVGYGDMTPQTPFGQFVASILMIVGYGVIAIPTGIVTAEISHAKLGELNEAEILKDQKVCNNCGAEIFLAEANYCHNCGIHFED
jgi:voltage-gated potassium channel